jgi:REP element-mobilizing transposase RayT
VIRSFKSICTKRINALRSAPGHRLWQRNYYERVVRNQRELNAIRQYVHHNSLHWEQDREHPSR